MPCGAAYKLAGITDDAYAKYPKLKALAARTAAVPEIKEYLTTSKTIGQGGFGHENNSPVELPQPPANMPEADAGHIELKVSDDDKPKMFYFPISGFQQLA